MAGKDDGKPSKRGDASKVGAGASRASAKAQAKAAGGPAASSRRGRNKPAPVKKPFPVGFAAGVAVLVLLLGGILVYAATNVGSGLVTALDKADDKFSGLRVEDNLDSQHTDPFAGQRVDYPDRDVRPPLGGNHNQFWYKCGPYTSAVVTEHAVHSMEHGAVWVTYKTDLPADQVKALTDKVAGNPLVLLSPYPGQTAPVVATSWGRQIEAQSASDSQLEEFVDVYAGGPQTREVGAGCDGQITKAGNDPFVPGADGSTFVPGPGDGALVPVRGPIPAVSGRPTEPGGTPTPGASATAAPGTSTSPAPRATSAPAPAPTR